MVTREWPPEREKMLAPSIEALIGRLFTDRKFLRIAKEQPDIVTHLYNLSKREAEGVKEIISKMDKTSAAELAKVTVASGYGCSGGGDT